MRKILKLGEIEVLREHLSENSFTKMKSNRHAFCELENKAYLITFDFWDVRKPSKKHDKVYIYCSKDELIYLSNSSVCLNAAEKIDEELNNFSQTCEFLIALTAEDVYALDTLENRITAIEDVLLTNSRAKRDYIGRIINLRREMLNIKRYYDQLGLIASELSVNKASLFNEEVMKQLEYLLRRIDRLLKSVMQLREYVTHVREAYQAQLDIEQNQTMKIFTLITAVFLPLTLIVGWYGMNLQLPEYSWDFGYPFVIGLSLAVSALCVVIFKIKRWF